MVLGLLVLGTAWLGWRARQASQELAAARAEVGRVETALLAGDAGGARGALAATRGHTARARALTSGPVWWLAARPPYLGDPARAVRTATEVADRFSTGVAPALVDAAGALAPDRLHPAGDRIAVDAIVRLRPTLARTREELDRDRRTLDRADRGWLPGPVRAGLGSLRAGLDQVSGRIDDADRTARLLAPLLGADGPRRYLVVFQNNAEARGTGGLPGMYAVLSVRDGRVRLDRYGSHSDLATTDLARTRGAPVDLGPEYRALWGADPALWANSNLDPNFPYAARIWLSLWQRQTGQRLDGVVASDPVAMSYLLGATGPIRLPGGDQLTAATLVPLTMRDVYARYPDPARQDAFLGSVAGTAMQAVLSRRGDPRAMLGAMSRAARERRLLVYSAHPAEQRDLAGTAVSGVLPAGPGPFGFVVVNNVAGSKMDYYLDRSITYTGAGCSQGERSSLLRIRLGNAVRPGQRLPRYVAQRLDSSTETRSQSAALGSVVVMVSVWGARDAGMLSATLDGRPLAVASGTGGGRPVWSFPVVVPPGAGRTAELRIVEPASAAAAVVPVQPLVRPARVRVSMAACR